MVNGYRKGNPGGPLGRAQFFPIFPGCKFIRVPFYFPLKGLRLESQVSLWAPGGNLVLGKGLIWENFPFPRNFGGVWPPIFYTRCVLF